MKMLTKKHCSRYTTQQPQLHWTGESVITQKSTTHPLPQ